MRDEEGDVFDVLGGGGASGPAGGEDGAAPDEEEVYAPEFVVAVGGLVLVAWGGRRVDYKFW